MMLSLASSVHVFALLLSTLVPWQLATGHSELDTDSIYTFNATNIDGKHLSFETYRGYVLLVVNVASECGLTESNYKQLNDLYSRYAAKGLRIAAFPCNQFGSQEPGDEEAIKHFVYNQKVQFDVYSKVDVNGENAHAIFQWLKSKLGGSMFIDAIKWNFTKFLIDCYGQPVKRYGPLHEPKDIESDLVEQLEIRTRLLKHFSTDTTSKGSRESTEL